MLNIDGAISRSVNLYKYVVHFNCAIVAGKEKPYSSKKYVKNIEQLFYIHKAQKNITDLCLHEFCLFMSNIQVDNVNKCFMLISVKLTMQSLLHKHL